MTIGLGAGDGGVAAPDEHPAHNAMVTNRETSSRTPIIARPPAGAYGFPASWRRFPKDRLPGRVAATRPAAGAIDGDHRGKDDRLCRALEDRKSTRLNSSHMSISYAVF